MSVFIKSLHLKNILSFKDTKLDLQPLNVLIGPNGSGKSNLIDVIGLLQAVPQDLPAYFRRHGPMSNWVWNGAQPFSEINASAPEFKAVLTSHDWPMPLMYEMTLVVNKTAKQYGVTFEALDVVQKSHDDAPPILKLDHLHGIISNGEFSEPLGTRPIEFTADHFRHDSSVLSQINDPLNYPIAADTARRMAAIKLFSSWHVGRDSLVRRPQRTDGDPNFLEEDFSNLALVVNDLLSRRLEPSLNDYLKRFYESYESLHPRIFGNTIELIVNEAGLGSSLPASRLSDGTIRFIALLAILCHPDPPPLICIEEPEIAMHPDSLDLVVELLKQASERTQLIVTTHSPWLIDRLSAKPDQVVVCDRKPGEGTQFKRFTREELKHWLEDQPLGEVWMAGAMGGVH